MKTQVGKVYALADGRQLLITAFYPNREYGYISADGTPNPKCFDATGKPWPYESYDQDGDRVHSGEEWVRLNSLMKLDGPPVTESESDFVEEYAAKRGINWTRGERWKAEAPAKCEHRRVQETRGAFPAGVIIDGYAFPQEVLHAKICLDCSADLLSPAEPAPKFSIGEYPDQPSKPGPREFWVYLGLNGLTECGEHEVDGAFKVREVCDG
jgi:hypothetical protein